MHAAVTLCCPSEVWKSMPRDNLEQHAFVTARVPDTNLVSDLQAAQGQFTG